MILTLTSTAEPATDLGYLLHKHPDRVQEFPLSFGTARVFYPEAGPTRCTVCVLVDVLPDRRRRGGVADFALEPYVNDSRDAASSMLAVALHRVFGTAMSRRCDARPDLVHTRLPLTVSIAAVPADDHEMPRRLFAPLGWQVETRSVPWDPEVPRWGAAPYVDLVVTGHQTVADALLQLYVLLPVLGGRKHYWVGPDEVDKLIRSGDGWLQDHPEQQLIMSRYLAYRRSYLQDATDRLNTPDEAEGATPEPARAPTLAHGRQRAVLAFLEASGAHRVVDLGCGEGTLLLRLAAEPQFTEIVGADPSNRALERAERRLADARLSDRQRERIRVRQSSVSYRDPALTGFDAMVLMEVIEHLDQDRIPDLERTVFGAARPGTVIITTPNRDANAAYPGLAAGGLRHPDHRFEWSRSEFEQWTRRVADTYPYAVTLHGIDENGPADLADGLGAPTQAAVFSRTEPSAGGDR
ncbi:MAG TPA: 3' terminal RNA ribose 2'-O-methyltransferase Hen1 [Microlunatus sp.]